MTDDHAEQTAAVEAATEELTTLVVDQLIPVVHRLRIETARRLEEGGHVRRDASAGHEQGIEVSLVPHEERDRIVAAFRSAVRDLMRSTVHTFGLHRPERRARAAGQLIHLVHALHLVATSEAQRDWWRAAIVRRRRARLARGMG